MKSASSLFKNIIKYQIWYAKSLPLYFWLSMFFNITLAVIPFLGIYLFSELLNKLTNLSSTTWQEILTIFALLTSNGIIRSIISKFSGYFEQKSYLEISRLATFQLIRKISSLDLSRFEDNKFILRYNKTGSVAEFRLAEFIQAGNDLFYYIIQIVSAFLIIINISSIYIPIIILTLLPSLIVSLKFSKRNWGLWELKGDKKNRYYDLSFYLKNRNYLNEIRVFGIVDKLFGMLKEMYDDFFKEQKKIMLERLLFRIFSGFIEIGGIFYIDFDLLKKVFTSSIQIGTFTFIRNSIDKFSIATNDFLTTLGKMYDHSLYIDDFEYIMNLKNEIVNLPNAYKLEYKTPKIEFRNVSFHYPGTEKLVFDNLSLTIEPGEDIALVGENGAGKTTFVKLLTRIYDVSSGEILIDGKDLKEIDLSTWYANLGALSQSFNSYALTVRENITLGGNDNISTISEEQRIERAVRLAECTEMIENLDKKYDQILSKAYEGGTDLSGGQWQRIALARAFYRDPNVLILDEPTSAIDAKAEFEIFSNILKENNFKTTIIISHRFSTVRNADKIYVVDKGKIVESGSHEDLMNLNGKYREMFELQAKGYE